MRVFKSLQYFLPIPRESSVLIICCCFFSFSFAQTPATETPTQHFEFSLSDCLEYALKQNLEIQNGQLDVQIDKVNNLLSISEFLPNIKLNSSFTDSWKVPTSLLPGEFFGQPGTYVPVEFGVRYGSDAAFSFENKINGDLFVALEALKLNKKLTQLNNTLSKEKLSVNVFSLFHSAILYRQLAETLDQILLSFEKDYKNSEALYKEGFIEKLDLDKLKFSVSQTQYRRDNFVGLYSITINTLKSYMGMDKDSTLALKGDWNQSLAYVAENPSENFNVDEVTEIKQSLIVKDLLTADLKRYKLRFLPTLTLFSTYAFSFQNTTLSTLFNEDYKNANWGLRLSLPIFSGALRIGQIKNAKLELRKQENTIAKNKSDVSFQHQSLLLNFKMAQDKINLEKKGLDIAQENVRQTKIKYELGIVSASDLQEAQEDYLNQELNYYSAIQSAIEIKTNLYKLLGKFKTE